MTVNELIRELMKIPNQEQKIYTTNIYGWYFEVEEVRKDLENKLVIY